MPIDKISYNDGPMNTKEYRAYRKKCEELLAKDPDTVLTSFEEAKRMGFEQLSIDLKKPEPNALYKKTRAEALKKPGFEFGRRKQLSLMTMRLGILPKMLQGMKAQFGELPQNDDVGQVSMDPVEVWRELNEYAREKWDIHSIGFTKVPREVVFKDHMVLYRYAIVMVEEMKKSEIDQAPSVPTTTEVMRVYAHLGEAANDVARWLRNKGLKCQPLHPLGGLLNTVPLAGKAGLGWLGKNGMLITPEFGPRHRVTPVLLEKPFFEFTDSKEHSWVEEFCKTCGNCARSCPTGAILDEKELYGDEIEGLGYLKRCIDQLKCFSYFEPTGGCSVCLKVCPFSQGDGIYDKIKVKQG